MVSLRTVIMLEYAKLSYAAFVSELAEFLAPSKEPSPHRSDLYIDSSLMYFTIVRIKEGSICRKTYS